MKIEFFEYNKKKYANVYLNNIEEYQPLPNIDRVFIFKSGNENMENVLDRLLSV